MTGTGMSATMSSCSADDWYDVLAKSERVEAGQTCLLLRSDILDRLNPRRRHYTSQDSYGTTRADRTSALRDSIGDPHPVQPLGPDAEGSDSVPCGTYVSASLAQQVLPPSRSPDHALAEGQLQPPMPMSPAPRQRASEPPAHPPSQISIALIDGANCQRADALAASADSLLSHDNSAESKSESQAERRRAGRAQRHWRRRAWAQYLQAARAFSRAALEQRVMARAARRCHARQLARRALAGLLNLPRGGARGMGAAVEQQHPTPCALRSDADTGSSARPHGGISSSTRTAAAHHHPQSAAPRDDITAAELSEAARAAAPAAARYDEVEVRAAALGGQVTAAAVALRHRRTLLLLRALRMWTREACLRCGLRERTQMAALLSRTALLARSVAAWRGSSGGGDAGSGDGGGGGSSGGGGAISAAGAAVAAPQAAAAAQQRNGGSTLRALLALRSHALLHSLGRAPPFSRPGSALPDWVGGGGGGGDGGGGGSSSGGSGAANALRSSVDSGCSYGSAAHLQLSTPPAAAAAAAAVAASGGAGIGSYRGGPFSAYGGAPTPVVQLPWWAEACGSPGHLIRTGVQHSRRTSGEVTAAVAAAAASAARALWHSGGGGVSDVPLACGAGGARINARGMHAGDSCAASWQARMYVAAHQGSRPQRTSRGTAPQHSSRDDAGKGASPASPCGASSVHSSSGSSSASRSRRSSSSSAGSGGAASSTWQRYVGASPAEHCPPLQLHHTFRRHLRPRTACSTSIDESAPLPPPALRRAPALNTALRGGALPGGYAGAAAAATAADTHTTAASLAQLRLGQLLMTSRQADMSSITIGSSVDFSSSDARSPAMIAQRACSGRLQARSAGLGGAAAALLPVAAPATAAAAVVQRQARSYCRDTPRTTAEESRMWRHGGGGGGDQSLEVGGLDLLDDRLGGVPQPHPYPQVPQTVVATTHPQARQRSNKVTLALNTPLSTSSLGQQYPVPHPSPARSHHGSDHHARSMSTCAALSAGSWSVASSGVSALTDAAVAARRRRQLRAGLVRWVDGVLALQQRSSADSVSTTGARLLQQRRAVQQWLVATRRPRTRSTAASTSAAAAAGAAAAMVLRAVRQWQRSAAARARLSCAAETWSTLRPRVLAVVALRAWQQRCVAAARRRRRQQITAGHTRRNVLRHAVAQWRSSALAAAGAVRAAALADAAHMRWMQTQAVGGWHCCFQRHVRMRAIGSRVLARWALTRWRRSALAPSLAATGHLRRHQLTRGCAALRGASLRRRSLQLSSAAHRRAVTKQAICNWRRAARGKVPFVALLAGSKARRTLRQWASSARLACATHRVLAAALQHSALQCCSSALQLWRQRARQQSAVKLSAQRAAATRLSAQLGRGVRGWSHFVATQRAHRRQQLLRQRRLALLQWRARHLCARDSSRRRAALVTTAAAAAAAFSKQRALRTWQHSAGEMACRRSLAPRFTQRYVFGLWRANAAARRRDRAAHRRALRHRCRRRALLAVRTLLQSARSRQAEKAVALTAQQHWRRRQQCAGAAALHVGARRWRRRARHLDFARVLRLRRAAAAAWVRRTRVAHLLRCRRTAADAFARRCAGLRAAARLLDFAAARRAQRRAARLAAAANSAHGGKVGVQVWARNRVRAAAAAELCVAAAAIAKARVLAASVAQWRTAGQLQQVQIAAVHRAEAKWALTARRRVVREWRAGAAAARVNSAQQDVATLNWGSTLMRRVMRAWQGWAALQHHHQQQQQEELHEQRRSQSPPARRQHYRIHLLRSQHLLQPIQAQELQGPARSNAECRCVLPLPQPSRSATAAAKG